MECPTIINWACPFPFKGYFVVFFIFAPFIIVNLESKQWRPWSDSMFAVSDLDLHWLYMSQKKTYGLICAGRQMIGHVNTLFPGHFTTASVIECRTKHPGTNHPMPFFATPDKTSRIDLPPRTKHPMQFLSPRTKYPMPICHTGQNIPCHFCHPGQNTSHSV